ncbi:hypothetical protein ABGB17_30385 [Sphaerisporangium sp. B11E5]|uniref:hypothetical protein n=1 Tax=Sphaerisporangium sp. B11E5 TaxID=3153563 RepID=UPI00325D4923
MMRRLRTAVALAGIATGLLMGLGTPAQAAAPTDRSAVTTVAAPGWWRFGVYYTLDACQYFGNSLTQSPQFSSYYCSQSVWDTVDQRYYWGLWVYQVA